MSITHSVDEIISQHTVFEIESIDRMYLNLYMNRVQSERGTADFFINHRKEACATALVMSQMTRKFVAHIESFAKNHDLEIVPFEKNVRKDDLAKQYLEQYPHQEGIQEGIYLIGKAQKKCKTFRTITKTNPKTGKTYPHHDAGFHYQSSILQIELSLTLVFDRPQHGRLFFEQIIRDNLTMGRAENVQLIFGRKVVKTTPSDFKTKVVARETILSFRVLYKNSSIKQYFKEGRALRTETTINNTNDFYVGRLLHNLPKLREIGFGANRRLLNVERLHYDPMTGQAEFERMVRPMEVGTQRASGFSFGDPVVLALMSCLLVYRFQINGLTNKELRGMLVELTGDTSWSSSSGRLTYQLRRLRLRGLIEREPGRQRYRVTDAGLRTAAFYTSSFTQIIYPNAASQKT